MVNDFPVDAEPSWFRHQNFGPTAPTRNIFDTAENDSFVRSMTAPFSEKVALSKSMLSIQAFWDRTGAECQSACLVAAAMHTGNVLGLLALILRRLRKLITN